MRKWEVDLMHGIRQVRIPRVQTPNPEIQALAEAKRERRQQRNIAESVRAAAWAGRKFLHP